jgi:hypothetical protein
MFTTYKGDSASAMMVNGVSCVFNSPKAVKGEQVSGLPPYAPRKAYMVDEYPGCPDSWMHGSSKANSYFVPIAAEHGMWLDFNQCFNHTHHIAVLVSVQGVNPITGMPLIDGPMRLEQYRNRCPKHDKEFGAELYCEECGYKWCPQNYLSTTCTPNGLLWLDGFRADDGTVRQYYFTEEECKGVAAQIIGDKRVYAIGIAFYQSKSLKPKPVVREYVPVGINLNQMYGMKGGTTGNSSFWHIRKRGIGGSSAGGSWALESAPSKFAEISNHYNDSSEVLCSFEPPDVRLRDSNDFIDLPNIKSLEIGAGAKIKQSIYRDTEKLDFYEDAPIGMLYINYVQEEEAKRIIAIGKKDMSKKGNGFLEGLKVGNV